MVGEQELVCDLSNGAISNDLERPLTLVVTVTPYFDTEYLTNGYKYGHSYYRRRIGNRIQAFEWHVFTFFNDLK